MKAVVYVGSGQIDGLHLQEVEEQKPLAGEVQVSLKVAGINHRDLFLLESKKEAFFPGSDGAGVVIAVGEGVTNIHVGDEVVLNPSLRWEKASEVPAVPEILDGTFAETIVVPAENVELKPKHLSWEEAGILPLAALTAYRALFTRARVKPGEHVLIPGIGSGVATITLLLAKAAGAYVTVTSRSAEKREQALRLGADSAFDSSGKWDLSRKVDVIIESIGSAIFERYFSVLREGGRIVSFGATTGDRVEIPLRTFFFQQWSMLSTSMGSREEFQDLLRFVTQHRLRPIVDRAYKLEEVRQAFQRMQAGEQFGKIAFLIE